MPTTRLAQPAALVLTALAAALSPATVALAGDGQSRVALLPLSVWPLAAAVTAAFAVVLLGRRGASLMPVALLGLVLLPFVPGPLPAALLIWTGPAVGLVWLAVGLAMAASLPGRRRRLPSQAAAAGLLAFLIYGAAAWRAAPAVPGGDEPHYLIITQSLLADRDLRIENNHRRGDYRAYFAGDLSKPDYYRRGVDGEIYSVHAPGISALVLPAFAIGGYRGVELFLLLLAAAGASLAWSLARRVTGRTDAAWFGWAAVTLAPTTVLNSFTVYPDGAGAVLVLTGLWAIVRAREERDSATERVAPWLAHGAALALLPWLHTRFALLAGGLGALVVLDLARTRNPAAKASAFLAIPTVSALAWIGYFVRIYGTADPASPYRGSDLGSPAYIAGGLGGLLFDQLYGLLATAPVLVAAAAGLVALAVRPGPFRALAWQLPFVALPYALTVTHFAMWWGGFSAPARFLVCLLPALAVPAAAGWAAAERRGTRALLLALLVATAVVTLVLAEVDRGRMAYVLRDSVQAPWLSWASRVADLAAAAPAFFSRVAGGRPGGLFFAEAGVWLLALGGSWLALRTLGDRRWARASGRLATLSVAILAVAAMLAATGVWRLEGVSGRLGTSSALHLLRETAGGGPAVALDLSRGRWLSRDALLAGLRMPLLPDPVAGRRGDVPLVALPLVPAGDYALTVAPGGAAGYLMIGIGRDQYALRTGPASGSGAQVLRFPVDVRALVVKGDEEARRDVTGLVLEPRRLLATGEKAASGVARRAVRYGEVEAFFMDERSFPEPAGFWVGGGRRTAVVFQPDTAGAALRLQIRNGPVANRLTVGRGAWQEALTLTPDQVVAVDVPVAPAEQAAAVTFDAGSGFRPVDVDADSRDTRFLGVWVAIR